jgi:hypothetical protein
MAKGYKIRISDGSEIGPMDLQGVRDWYTQGLIAKDSLVFTPELNRWVPLQQVLSPPSGGGGRPSERGAAPSASSRPAAPRPAPARASSAVPVSRSRGPIEVPWRALGIAAGLVMALVVAGAVALWLRPGAEEARILEWVAAETVMEDAALDLRLKLSRGWRLLRPEQSLVTAPAAARAVLAHPRRGGFGYLLAESAAARVVSADDCLSAVLETRRRAGTAVTEGQRADVMLGKVAGRQAEGTWSADGRTYRDLTVAAVDGGTCIALAAWVPGEGPSGELAALREALALEGVMASRVAEAVRAAVGEAPHLSTLAAEMVMASSSAKVLNPATAFRRGFELADRGVPGLTPAESRELGSLVAGACSNLSSRDRDRLTAYFQRVREHRVTTPDEDREMAGLMKSGVGRLPTGSRSRLQVLYEKAIRSGLNRG